MLSPAVDDVTVLTGRKADADAMAVGTNACGRGL